MTRYGPGLRWFLIGSAAAILLTAGQARATGDLSGLLQVGESSALRPLIEDQLGEVHLAPGSGHDGQIYYGIALDLGGRFVPDLIGDDPAYRYRRILFPAVTSGFGLLDGWALLYSMVTVNVASVGVAAGTVAFLAVRRGFSELWALAVILNPGVWLSIFIVTGDALSLALMLVGVAFALKERRSAALAFAGSVLSKEVAILTPLGLWSWRRRQTWLLLGAPVITLALWMMWTSSMMGGGFTARGNLTFPFVGIVNASSNWSTFPVDEWILLGFALGSVVLGLFMGVFREGPLRWCVLLWSVIGVVSSNWVWDFGNNAARVFAPLGVLVVVNALYSRTSPEITTDRARTPKES